MIALITSPSLIVIDPRKMKETSDLVEFEAAMWGQAVYAGNGSHNVQNPTQIPERDMYNIGDCMFLDE